MTLGWKEKRWETHVNNGDRVRQRSLVTPLVAVVAVACGTKGPEYGPLVANRDTVGDTVVVRIASGSLWGHPISATEDLRVGIAEGDGPEAFGEIDAVAVESDGAILVFDGQVPALRRFSKSGTYLGTIGGKGEGPGEYAGRPNGMMVDRNGRIIVNDSGNGRLTAYSAEGEFLGSLGAASGLRSLFGQAVAGDDEGRLYVHVLMVAPGPGMPTPWPIGAEVRNSSGAILDTIPPPMLDGEPATFFGVLPDGSILAATIRSSHFEIQQSDGRVVRVELPFERVPYTEEEVARLRTALRPAAAADGKSKVSVPETKAAYIDVLCGPGGRVWLRRPIEPRSKQEAAAVPRFQASILDVFEEDGTYLGAVELPRRSWPVVVSGEELYVIQLGRYDEQYLVRLKVTFPK